MKNTAKPSARRRRFFGVPAENLQSFDGLDILGLVASDRPIQARAIFWRKPRGETIGKAARQGDFKYVRHEQGTTVREFLFQVVEDPGERHDLRHRNPVLRFRKLQASYAEWEHRVRLNRRGQTSGAP